MFGSSRPYGPVTSRGAPTHHRSLISDTWFLEIGALCLSTAALLGQIILLQSYNEKPLFTWHGLTLNTWVSILSTTSKTSLLFAVSSCLGQWKFINHSRSDEDGRPLFGFDVLDSASRGPYGAMIWLFYSRLRSIATIGALITIITLALDPFAQQIVGLGQLGIIDSKNTATIPQILRYSRAAEQSDAEAINVDAPDGNSTRIMTTSVDNVVYTSLLFSLSQTTDVLGKSFAAPVCPGSSCDWDTYRSLAVCGECRDISQLIKVTQNGSIQDPYISETFASATALLSNHTEARLPNGQFIADTSTTLSGTDGYNRTESFAFKDVDTYLWSATILQNSTGGKLQAQECAMLICVNEYKSTWENGSLSETITKYGSEKVPDSHQAIPGWTWHGVTTYVSDPNQDSLYQTFDYGRYDLQLKGKGNETFNITQGALNTLGAVFSGSFGGSVNNDTGVATYCGGSADTCGGARGVTSIYGANYTSFNETFHAMALSVSNSMRGFADNGTTIQGRVNIQVYKIRWPWIALPCALSVASVIFLVWTMIETRLHGVPLWKLSALPTVLYGSTWAEDTTRPKNLGAMERNARRINCRVKWAGSVIAEDRSDVIELKPGAAGPSRYLVRNVSEDTTTTGAERAQYDGPYNDISPVHYDYHEHGDLGRRF